MSYLIDWLRKLNVGSKRTIEDCGIIYMIVMFRDGMRGSEYWSNGYVCSRLPLRPQQTSWVLTMFNTHWKLETWVSLMAAKWSTLPVYSKFPSPKMRGFIRVDTWAKRVQEPCQGFWYGLHYNKYLTCYILDWEELMWDFIQKLNVTLFLFFKITLCTFLQMSNAFKCCYKRYHQFELTPKHKFFSMEQRLHELTGKKNSTSIFASLN